MIEDLKSIYPPDRLLLQSAQLAPYESDGLTCFRSKPAAVVLPETQKEVIKTVRWCYENSVPFSARGSGTSLSGGAIPVKNGLVIALNRLNRIVRIDPQERTITVESGVVNLKVSEAVLSHNLCYAPDPSSQPICTIGGNLAFNSGGAHCLKYGMTSNHVLGIKAVLPDGEVVQLGGQSLETVGPDLTGFYCGSEGLFGVALEVVLRLIPKPEFFRTMMVAYDAMEAAGNAVTRIVSSGLLPGALEIMDGLAITAAEAAVDAGYPKGAAAILIVELDGEKDAVESDFKRLKTLIEETAATTVKVAQNDAERIKIWKGRKSAFSAVGRLSSDFIVQDGVVPRARLGEALAEIDKLSKIYNLRVANVFHAGDGNLHPLILFDGREEGALHKAEELAGKIIKLCIRMGGSITGEHGVGLEKKAYLPEMFSAQDIRVMEHVRSRMDPKMISNSDKMIPGGEAPALVSQGLHPLEKQGILSRE